MIKNLSVHGVGGIKSAELSFNGEFIVITGESGSGKSSLVRALEFISGKRAQVNYIHAREEYSEVSAEYSSKTENESHKVMRRFGKDGRATLTHDGHLLTVGKLSELMEQEIVIQSQYAQLSLLEPTRQLELVDSCGGTELAAAKETLAKIFEQALVTEKELVALKNKRKELSEKYANAEKEIALINSLKITPESEGNFERELKELNEENGKVKAMYSIYSRISGAESGGGLLDLAAELCRDIRALDSEDKIKTEAAEQLLAAAQKISQLFETEMKSIIDAGSIEEARDTAEERLGQLRKLKRALKVENCTELLNYALEAQQAVVWLQTSLLELKRLEATSAELRKNVISNVQTVRTLRKQAAATLEQKVNASLADLAMGYAKFEIEIAELDRVRANGAESAQFMLRLPEQQPMPVSKTASGGELSRILIALQLAVGDDKLPGTLVFDEVEAGLGGKSALLAGYKLKELSQRCRTILITHEATIAAMADSHFLVRREGDDTLIQPVSGQMREREIARMLSGDENSPQALEHARALLAQ